MNQSPSEKSYSAQTTAYIALARLKRKSLVFVKWNLIGVHAPAASIMFSARIPALKYHFLSTFLD